MKTTVDRQALVDTLEVVGRALATNNLVPIFTHFCFDSGFVYAYNDTIGISAQTDVEGPFALHGDTLLGLLTNCDTKEVTFETRPEHVLLTAGKSEFKLPYMGRDEFLFKPPVNFGYPLPLNEEFRKGLEICWHTVGDSKATPLFAGVGVTKENDLITMYSTDGDATTRFYGLHHDGHFDPIFLPYQFCETILRIEGFGPLYHNRDWAVAQFEKCKIYGRLLGEDPLDYKSEIESLLTKVIPEFISVPEGLKEALIRAEILAGKETKASILSVGFGGLEILTQTSFGESHDTFEFEGTKYELGNIKVSAPLMRRSLEICDQVSIHNDFCIFKKGEEVLVVLGNM